MSSWAKNQNDKNEEQYEMHRTLQNGCGRSAARDRAEHESDREKDNVGWS
jgi:hypothetical protein